MEGGRGKGSQGKPKSGLEISPKELASFNPLEPRYLGRWAENSSILRCTVKIVRNEGRRVYINCDNLDKLSHIRGSMMFLTLL